MKKILLVSTLNIEKDTICEFLTDINQTELDVIPIGSIAEAEEILFEVSTCLIIIEWELEGAAEFTYNLKSDEMFRLLPILALIQAGNKEARLDALSKGVDNYLYIDSDIDQLPLLVRPLVVNNLLNDEIVQKNSVLQEQAIHDFILLDLIKKYIPKTIWNLANVFAHEQKICIPEEEMELTIAFGDIKGFTRMSQHLPPIDVIRNLNSVFEIITRIIYAHDGDIDKFIGDAFLAVFNQPANAIKAMVKVQIEIAELNKLREADNKPAIMFRIGIHTGPIIRGNVGGEGRYDNTLIGDTVNTASRLESLSQPGDILISETTRQKAGLDIHPEKQFEVTLKGKDNEELVYQVFDLLKDAY